MVKKTFVECQAVDTKGCTWSCQKIEVSKTSKMDIANIYNKFKETIKENGKGARLKEINFVFDEGV